METKDIQVTMLALSDWMKESPAAWLSRCLMYTPLKATTYILLQVERSSAFPRTILGKGKTIVEDMDIKRGAHSFLSFLVWL